MTTAYLDLEDRFRLAGETSDKELVGLWLTQRLLLRVLPHLIRLLENQRPPATATDNDNQVSGLLQGFAQEEAKQSLAREKPIAPVAPNEIPDFKLVRTVDLSTTAGKAKIKFNLEVGEPVILLLDQRHLRQWLVIIKKYWDRAGWPSSIWPAWMKEKKADAWAELIH